MAAYVRASLRASVDIRRSVGSLCLGLLLALVSGCLARSPKRVVLPGGDRAYRVQCNYTLANCRREAEDTCHGRYEELSRGDRSCRDCGMELNQANVETGESPVYRGVLYFRCR